MIPHETIQKIIDAADIVEVVSDFINLRKQGADYKGLCPFHDDKKPSFSVSPRLGICKCFSCGEGGNPINFIMKHEQMSYVEALRYLAKKYNIEIVEREQTDQERQADNERQSLMILTKFAEKYFSSTLHKDLEGIKVGLTYFNHRGINNNVIKHFHLGYCKDNFSAFSDYALESGYDKKFLIDTGLSSSSKNGLIDKMRGRIIFPIHNVSGRVIGFGGRILGNKKVAKYINSPESLIYHKRKVLYGIYFAKKSIVKKDRCFLVEGYTDVLAMYQAGIENVVSSSGTALTPDQIRLIKRFSYNITIVFDGDEAGINASMRSIDLLLEQDMNVKVLPLPEGEDPDSFSRSLNASELQKYIEEKQEDFIYFKSKLLLKGKSNDPVERSKVIRDIVRSISLIPQSLTRSEYIRSCSELFGTPEIVLYNQISKLIIQRRDRYHPKVYRDKENRVYSRVESNTGKITPKDDYEELELLRLLLNYGVYPIAKEEEDYTLVGEYIIDEIMNDIGLTNTTYLQIFKEFDELLATDNFLPIDYPKQYDDNTLEKLTKQVVAFFVNHQEETVATLATNLVIDPHKLSKLWTKDNQQIELENQKLHCIVPKAVYEYKYKVVRCLIDKTKQKIKECKDEAVLLSLLNDKQNLDTIKREIIQKIGARIIVK